MNHFLFENHSFMLHQYSTFDLIHSSERRCECAFTRDRMWRVPDGDVDKNSALWIVSLKVKGGFTAVYLASNSEKSMCLNASQLPLLCQWVYMPTAGSWRTWRSIRGWKKYHSTSYLPPEFVHINRRVLLNSRGNCSSSWLVWILWIIGILGFFLHFIVSKWF